MNDQTIGRYVITMVRERVLLERDLEGEMIEKVFGAALAERIARAIG